MLPSRLLSGPLVGNLYKIHSPNDNSSCLKLLPLIRCHGVRPSEPRQRAFSRMHVCSKSQAVMACAAGMYLPILASRHNLSVRNIPRTNRTPTSIAPLDWES